MFATEPPAAAPLSALDRRTLLKTGILGLGVAGAPLAAQSGGQGFSHGVASGEPAAERVLLWTRFVGAQDTALEFEVSEMLDFSRVAAGGSITARAISPCTCRRKVGSQCGACWMPHTFSRN